MLTLKAVVEALLFSSQRPLTAKEILQVVRLGTEYATEEEQEIFKGMTEATIQNVLVELSTEYQQLERAFQLVEQVSGWQLTTKPEHQTWGRQLFPDLRPTRLSPPDPGWPGLAPAAALLASGTADGAVAAATPEDRAAKVRSFVDGAGTVRASVPADRAIQADRWSCFHLCPDRRQSK